MELLLNPKEILVNGFGMHLKIVTRKKRNAMIAMCQHLRLRLRFLRSKFAFISHNVFFFVGQASFANV